MIRVLAALFLWLGGGMAWASTPSSAATHDQQSSATIPSLAPLAAGLLDHLPTGARIAIKPFEDNAAGLPSSFAASLNDRLISALQSRGDGRVTIIARDRLQAVWAEAVEFRDADIVGLLAESGANVLVIGRVVPTRNGIELSYRAVSTKKKYTGRILAQTQAISIPLDRERFRGLPLGAAIDGAADRLLRTARSALSSDAAADTPLRISRAGAAGGFTDYLAALAVDRLRAGLGRSELGTARASRRAGEKAASLSVTLEVEVWDHIRVVTAQLSLLSKGGLLARRTIHFDPVSIPGHFRPLTRDGGRVGAGMAVAEASVVTRDLLPASDALRLARAAARARLIAERLSLGGGPDGFLRSVKQSDAIWPTLARGVTHEEIWSNERHVPDDRIEVSLRAKVAPLGGPDAPRIEAHASRRTYRAGEPLGLEVRGQRGRVNLAVYAWQADDSVVRLYPSVRDDPIPLDAGRTLGFPSRGEPHYAAAPLGNQNESRETLIVVAASGGFSPNDLAPPAGGTPERSVLDAVSSSGFFQSLSRLDTRRVTVRFLPYRVIGHSNSRRARN